MDLEDLRAFLAVLDHGSVQAAARTGRWSRTTLRRRLDALEAQVGLALLMREASGATPTAAGEVLAQRGRELVAQAQAVVKAARDRGDPPEGRLRLLLPVGLPPHLLAALFGLVRARYPRLEVVCQTSNDPARERLDEVDLLLHFGASGLTSGAWVATTLLRARERLLANPAYLAAAGTPDAPEALTEHLLVTWTPPGEDPGLWPLPEGRILEVRPSFCCADVHLIRNLAAAGQGIARVPDGNVREAPDVPGALVQVLPELEREIPLRAAIPEALLHRPKGRALFDMIRELAQLAETL